MGGIFLETDQGVTYPGYRYFASDSKWLLEMLTDEPTLPVCEEVLQLDLEPLRKTVVDWYIPPDPAHTWEQYRAAAWQAPDTVVQCITSLIEALTNTPDSYERLEATRVQRGLEFLNLSGFTDEEFVDGFHVELAELATLVQLAKAEGAQRVCLTGT